MHNCRLVTKLSRKICSIRERSLCTQIRLKYDNDTRIQPQPINAGLSVHAVDRTKNTSFCLCFSLPSCCPNCCNKLFHTHKNTASVITDQTFRSQDQEKIFCFFWILYLKTFVSRRQKTVPLVPQTYGGLQPSDSVVLHHCCCLTERANNR